MELAICSSRKKNGKPIRLKMNPKVNTMSSLNIPHSLVRFRLKFEMRKSDSPRCKNKPPLANSVRPSYDFPYWFTSSKLIPRHLWTYLIFHPNSVIPPCWSTLNRIFECLNVQRPNTQISKSWKNEGSISRTSKNIKCSRDGGMYIYILVDMIPPSREQIWCHLPLVIFFLK